MMVKRVILLLLVAALCFVMLFAFSGCRKGERTTCDWCNGTGYQSYSNGQFGFMECSKCKGKGFVFA